jgi:uncharacterized coiled-coil protein SlyX
MNTVSETVKQETKDVRKNYTRTANLLFESYPDLRPQEKWLYINLVYLCGAKGTRHLSLRYIHDRTSISLGSLSGSKDIEKNDPGMIRRLHNAGLIHAEIKKKTRKDGKEAEQAQYHITIVDIWQLNEMFFASKRSENEHYIKESNQSVQNPNSSVQEMNALTGERSNSERERSEFDTNIRLHSKTTDSNKITQQENITHSSDDSRDTHTNSFSQQLTDQQQTIASLQASLLEQQQQFALLQAKMEAKQSSTQSATVETPPPNDTPSQQTQASDVSSETPDSDAVVVEVVATQGKQQGSKGKGKGKTTAKPVEILVLTDEEKAKIEEEKAKQDELKARYKAIYGRIVARRGFELTEKRDLIVEWQNIHNLADEYSDMQIEAIHKYLFERDWRYSKPDNKYGIGAYIIHKESRRVAQILRDERVEQDNKSKSGDRLSGNNNDVSYITAAIEAKAKAGLEASIQTYSPFTVDDDDDSEEEIPQPLSAFRMAAIMGGR